MKEKLYYRMAYYQKWEDGMYRKLPIYSPVTDNRYEAVKWFKEAIANLDKSDNITFGEVENCEYDYRCRIKRVNMTKGTFIHRDGLYKTIYDHYLIELECFHFNPNE